jgi:integrase
MRPRYQDGSVQRRGNQWVLRFWVDRDGARVRTVKPLGSYDANPFRTPLKSTDEKLLRELLADRIAPLLSPVNQGRISTGNVRLGEFIENSYWARLEWRLKQPDGNELHIEPSTMKGYKDIYNVHVKNAPEANTPLRDFDSRMGQRFLESLPKDLSHQTHLRIKNFLSGVLTWAIADGALKGTNPMDATKAGGQRKVRPSSERQAKIQASNNHAYTLGEVAEMLDKLPEPARTVCAVAAFTGLSRSELRGLKWQDFDGKTIQVRRKIWNDYVGPTKTEAREAGVPVIPLLVRILEAYRKKFPFVGDGWIFQGEKLLNPLDLDNLSRREISQYIAWFGWHSFRRGLGTRLNEARVDGKTIQSILRHADISTTQAYYIVPDQKRAAAGLKKLDRIMRDRYGIRA